MTDKQGLELLVTSNDEYILRQVAAVLSDHDIAYIHKDQGSGGYMRLISGKSFYQSDIYVGREDLERAEKLIDFLEGY